MCAERNNVYKFPSPEERTSDPRNLLKKLVSERLETEEPKTDEPKILKNIPDTTIIKSILIKANDAQYMFPKNYSTLPDERPTTFGIIREILKHTPDSLKGNSRDIGVMAAYLDFLIEEVVKNIPEKDLLSQAELYKYIGKLRDTLDEVSTLKKDAFSAEHETFKQEIRSQFHVKAGNLFKTLSNAEKDPEKKEHFISECISEYLAQIQIYELKKKLSQEDFDKKIQYMKYQPAEMIKANRNLKQTLIDYDDHIKNLNKQILKLAKIK